MAKRLSIKPCPGGCGDMASRRAKELCYACRTAITKWRERESKAAEEKGGDYSIDGEQSYPIWGISAWWLEDIGDRDNLGERALHGAPEGRFWNATQHNKMFREEQQRYEVVAWARDWVRKILEAEKYVAQHATDPVLSIKFERSETWCLTWFSHHTYDVGQTDQEVLASFTRYVERTQALNRREGYHKNGYWHDKYTLMGAEDRFRWKGSVDDGDPNANTDPPCRCKHCKEQGLIRIGH